MSSDCNSFCVLGQEANSKEVPERCVHLDVLEVHVLAVVCWVAVDDSSWKQGVVACDVLQDNAVECDDWVGWAISIGVEHVATWVGTTGLVLLLGADPDCPPDWSVHNEVLVGDVGDLTVAVVARVRLKVDSLEWLVHDDVSEGHVSDACVVVVGRD